MIATRERDAAWLPSIDRPMHPRTHLVLAAATLAHPLSLSPAANGAARLGGRGRPLRVAGWKDRAVQGAAAASSRAIRGGVRARRRPCRCPCHCDRRRRIMVLCVCVADGGAACASIVERPRSKPRLVASGRPTAPSGCPRCLCVWGEGGWAHVIDNGDTSWVDGLIDDRRNEQMHRERYNGLRPLDGFGQGARVGVDLCGLGGIEIDEPPKINPTRWQEHKNPLGSID